MTQHPAYGPPRPLEVARGVGVAFAKAVGCETGGAECLPRRTFQTSVA